MLNVKEYVSGSELLEQKEKEFMERYTYLSLEELMCELEIPYELPFLESMDSVRDKLWGMFVFNLLEDSDFLGLNVISHFHREDGTHIFGIDLLGLHEPCECCGDVVSEWLAVTVNIDRMGLGFGYLECHDYERVEDSSYIGNTFYEVKALIDRYRIKDDYEEEVQ